MPVVDTRCGVKGLILDGDKGLVLLKPNKSIDLPGGRLEEGEGYRDGLKREVREETGLTDLLIGNSTVSWSFMNRSGLWIVGVTFLCWHWGGNITLSFEHSTYDWLPVSQLKGLDIYWKYGLDNFEFEFTEHSLD
jgi:8-oxo-dGTP pyrophosphatase MutT (NUDIX family)